MSTLYSLRTDGDHYRITKFVDGNPEGSYLTTESECECPAGHRHTCRHRQMLPTMLAHKLANSHYFFDFDGGGRIVDFNGTPKHLLDQLAAGQRDKGNALKEWAAEQDIPVVDISEPQYEEPEGLDEGEEIEGLDSGTQEETSQDTSSLDSMFNKLARIPGVTVMGLDDVGAVHNAIADAVGEPEAKLAVLEGQHSEPAPAAKPWRRL